MPDLRTKTSRARLKTRSAVYTQTVTEGRALLYRKRYAHKPGKWSMRLYGADGKYDAETLGTADDIGTADGKTILTYAQALELALGRRSADPTKLTVQAAMNDWADHKAATASSDKQAADLRSMARRIGGAFPKTTLKSITAAQIVAWMASDTKAARSTANRRLATLKAALTRAADLAGYQGDRAWLTVRKFKKAEAFGSRNVILTPEEEARLIAVARPDVARLLTALQMTGARFGEIRTATVGDLEGNRLQLSGKTGKRTITLSQERATWFAGVAGNRPAPEPLLTRQDGAGWPDGGQLKPMRTAVAAAGLNADVTTYALRHGFISRALSDGIPVVAVAQHCGTSVDMIEATYAKFTGDQMSRWFA